MKGLGMGLGLGTHASSVLLISPPDASRGNCRKQPGHRTAVDSIARAG